MYNKYGDDMNLFVIAQIFSLFVFIFEILTLISNDKKKVLIYNTLVNVFSSLQYFCLKAFTGAYAVLVTFLRNFIFSKYRNKNKKIPVYWLIIIVAILIMTNYSTYDGLVSIIPVITVGLYTLALWQNSINRFKVMNMFICFLSAVYSFHYGAYVNVISQIIFIIVSASSYTYNITSKNIKRKKKKTN